MQGPSAARQFDIEGAGIGVGGVGRVEQLDMQSILRPAEHAGIRHHIVDQPRRAADIELRIRARSIQCRATVKARLPAEMGAQPVGPGCLFDLLQ